MKQLIALVLMAVLMVSMVPGAVANLAGLDQHAKNQYQTYKERYHQSVEEYEDARADYMKAKELLGKAKNKENLSEAFPVAQEYGRKTINRIHSHLAFLDKALELYGVADDSKEAALMAEVEKHLAATAENGILQQRVDSAQTIADLVAVKNDIMNEWNNDKALLKWGVASVLNRKADIALEKMNNVYAKLDEKVTKQETLYPQDPTVSAMRTTLTQARADLDQLEAEYEEAKQSYTQIKDLKDADRLAQEMISKARIINQKLRAFHKDAVELVNQYNSFARSVSGEKELNGTGYVEAWGVGNITAVGTTFGVSNGRVEVDGNGTLTIIGNTTSLDIDGFGNKTAVPGGYQYTGDGTAVIKGENLTVMVSGTVDRFYAKGIGTVNLEGDGGYRKGKSPSVVFNSSSAVEVSMS
ncbi:hypothetical protein HYW21_09155 [Candidatus Woesearchaeota archaeon]|nr:hypothetical protein [Candidatus Woesearchaeota archaeon]